MFDNLKFYISLIIARGAYAGIKLFTKSSGTSFAGKTVLKFNPNFLVKCKLGYTVYTFCKLSYKSSVICIYADANFSAMI